MCHAGSVLLLRGREILSADWSLIPHEDAIQVQILAMFCRNKREEDDKKPEENVKPSPTEESTVCLIILDGWCDVYITLHWL
jgi:hypothetical protein